MKLATIIIVISVVWSVISSIIEKRKAAAKKESLKGRSQATLSTKPAPPRKWNAGPKWLDFINNPELLKVTKGQVEEPDDGLVTDVDTAKAKAQALRQPKKSKTPSEVVAEKPVKKFQLIKSLHEEDCPLPPAQFRHSRPSRSKNLARMLNNSKSIRTAIVLNEILSPPVSQRNKVLVTN